MLDHLLKYAPVYQLFASTFVAIAAASVATAAALFAYRNNFGWRPIVLVTSHGMGSGWDETLYDASLKFEVWNRRKYPIVIREINVWFNKIEVAQMENVRLPIDKEWLTTGAPGHLIYREEKPLAPNTHEAFTLAAPFKKRPLDGLEDRIRIRALFYDPRANKARFIRKTYHWHLRSLEKPTWRNPIRLYKKWRG